MTESPAAVLSDALTAGRRASGVPGRATARRFARNRQAVAGVVVVAALIAVAALAPVIAPYDPKVPDPVASLQGPGGRHLLGTDLLGRDTLSRLLYGSRVSLEVGIIT